MMAHGKEFERNFLQAGSQGFPIAPRDLSSPKNWARPGFGGCQLSQKELVANARGFAVLAADERSGASERCHRPD
jgi:hypothetical protein